MGTFYKRRKNKNNLKTFEQKDEGALGTRKFNVPRAPLKRLGVIFA
jgi:hypothetical protein